MGPSLRNLGDKKTMDREMENMIQKICERQTQIILDKFNERFNSIEQALSKLKDESASTIKKLSSIEDRMDDLEQYSRRNSIRVFGIPEEKAEDTDNVMKALIDSKFNNMDISIKDIDRSHRVGVHNKEHPRPILVKFVSYKTKSIIFRAKKDLKGTGIVIREDLCRGRNMVLKAAIEKYGSVNVWTLDGRIIINENGGKGTNARKRSATKISEV